MAYHVAVLALALTADTFAAEVVPTLSLSLISPSTRVCWSSVSMSDGASKAENANLNKTDPTLRWASWRRIIQLAVWKVGDGSSNFYEGSDDAGLVVPTLGNCSFDGRFLENFPTLISSLPILTPIADEANKDEFDESDDPDDGSDNE
ncbi:hypothetical protein F2Q69_00059217 [Brassica cretica]|uniref:Uncharacterized protein n=1 Tax=Brassica cretica TaxID=69181 RepID=A0A8S9RLL0_BRACR|nr:hypothetical protein F2Q69_00059217 [Brassica cretica]